MTKNVLFVCLGNIARSAMAEAMFTKMVFERGLADKINIDSAGTSNEEQGNPPHLEAQKILVEHHIPFEWIHARQINFNDLKWADYIITMDYQNLQNLQYFSSNINIQNKLYLIYSVFPEYADKEIQDPWYTERFDITFLELQETLPAWLEKISDNL